MDYECAFVQLTKAPKKRFMLVLASYRRIDSMQWSILVTPATLVYRDVFYKKELAN